MGFFATTPASSKAASQPHTARNAYPRFSGVTSGYRFYSPTISRWISRDPIGEKGFGLSRKYASHITGKNGHKNRTSHLKNYSEDYLFVRNDAVSKMDSVGLFIDDIYVDIGFWPPSIIGTGMSWRECKAPKVWMQKPAARPPEVNGCSFPWLLQWMLESDDNDPNNPSGYADFTAACSSHDKCYDNCSSEKGQCDKDLWRDMVEVCMLQAGSDNEEACVWWAKAYAWGVENLGLTNFKKAQEERCECGCPNGIPWDWGSWHDFHPEGR